MNEMTPVPPQQPPGTLARQEFGASEQLTHAETARAAAASQAEAAIQARYIVALRRPRDIDDARVRVLKECSRSGFAEVARYAKPIGGGSVAGFSIRFAEAAARCLTNICCEVQTVYDDPTRRIVRVIVTDLEANLTYPKDVLVEKTVERRHLKAGQVALSTRLNTQNQPVYILAATDDEVLVKENALVSKAMRNSILRLIPGDILDEAEAKIAETLRTRAEKDPDAERKKIADAFVGLGVMPSDLKAYLGHELAASSPAELTALRATYNAIKGGESTWAEVVAAQAEQQAPTGNGEKKPEKPAIVELTEKLKAQVAQAAAPARDPGDDRDDDPAAVPDGVIDAKPKAATPTKAGQRKLSE